MKTNLKYIRKTYGLTMRELAKQIGVSQNAINLWENQDVSIADKNLDALASILKIDKQLLIQEELSDEDLKEIAKCKYTYDINCSFDIKEIKKYECLSEKERNYFNKLLYCLESKSNILAKHVVAMLDDIEI